MPTEWLLGRAALLIIVPPRSLGSLMFHILVDAVDGDVLAACGSSQDLEYQVLDKILDLGLMSLTLAHLRAKMTLAELAIARILLAVRMLGVVTMLVVSQRWPLATFPNLIEVFVLAKAISVCGSPMNHRKYRVYLAVLGGVKVAQEIVVHLYQIEFIR